MILSYQLPLTQLGCYLISRTLLPKISYVTSISVIITHLEVVTAEVNGSLVMVNKVNRVNNVHMANPPIACMSL
jgi:hypothetical protein